MLLTMIVAMERSNGIGFKNKLPWRLKKDLQHFKTYTTGKLIVMGTNTLMEFSKPLPKRDTILLSRTGQLRSRFNDTILYARTVEEAIDLAKSRGESELVIAGGATVYESFLPHANRLIITHVNADVRSDTFFPRIDPSWELVDNQSHEADDENQFHFNICRYERK